MPEYVKAESVPQFFAQHPKPGSYVVETDGGAVWDISVGEAKINPKLKLATAATWPSPQSSDGKKRPQFTAPYPENGEMHDVYLMRLRQAFEDWVNCR